jgi:2-dehydro-3-deoxyphosphogluconate aldolase / (4S)-4-hydroxy-2-oxoglutarate aldolase
LVSEVLIVEPKNIIAIIRDVNPDDAAGIVSVLLEEGIEEVEVSLSNEEKGLRVIESLKKTYDLEVGAGTVITKEQVDKSLAAGADYIITPGWDRELVQYVKGKGAPILPGVYTPGDVSQAVSEGITTLKLFPAGTLEIDYIKSLFGPFPNVKLVGVGGITQENIKAYYDNGCSAFAIGSDLVHRGATSSEQDLEKIRAKAKVYATILKEG